MSKLGQIFYGRSSSGYGILGASPVGRPYVGFVAILCRAVGSPDRPGKIQPFLISKREGGSVIMIRACRGSGDPTGRSTLFFHALVASAEALGAANLDAFALADKGAFLSALPENIEDVEAPASTGRANALSSGELRYPAFVSSDCPLDSEVRRALGGETLTRDWATYSYRPFEGFDLCVHSSCASPSSSGSRYSIEGGRFVLLDGASPSTAGKTATSKANVPAYSVALKVSLVANAILAALLAYNFLSGGDETTQRCDSRGCAAGHAKTGAPTPLRSEMTEEEARCRWGIAWSNEWARNLRYEFESVLSNSAMDHIQLPVDVGRHSGVRHLLKQPQDEPNRKLYETSMRYVEFVEAKIFNKPIRQQGR